MKHLWQHQIKKCFRPIWSIELNASFCTMDRLIKRKNTPKEFKQKSRHFTKHFTTIFMKQWHLFILKHFSIHSLDSVTCSHSWNVKPPKYKYKPIYSHCSSNVPRRKTYFIHERRHCVDADWLMGQWGSRLDFKQNDPELSDAWLDGTS